MHKLITAIITPFNEENEIDYDELKVLIDDQVNNNVDGIVINGTTAETPTLSLNEKRSLVEFVINHTPNNFELIVGVSSNDTMKVVEEINNVDDLNFTSYMVCPPYYNKTTQEGLLAHYKYIFEHTKKPFVLYNIPSRCGVVIELPTLKSLCETNRVCAIKEASGDFSYFLNLVNSNLNIEVYNGNDDLIVPIASLGATGIISAISNAIPKEMKTICEFISVNDYESAKNEYCKYHNLINKTYEHVNPVGVKALTSLRLNINYNLRLPLYKATDQYLNELKELL